ncbi:NAD synthetase [Caballeronia glebae]|uniref:NH(3)-dependent NAD(+) synthetase n=1 Tax=Caballeronia glebae TaxID=1777143 RepID=A0A157ZLV8_9BURK|nr:ammonia-dependent NAD(+) synthetase [Caballeronia glebae]SAK46512.1 NAD synthetase [Caballeronia glebae]
MSNEHATRQPGIIEELKVAPVFDLDAERERRIAFLADYLEAQKLKSYVLGISGGVDSSTAGRLAQLAVERLRARHVDARFIAMRLPYGEQRDEADAQRALAFIQPDETLTVHVKPAADAMRESLAKSGVLYRDEKHEDFVLGNIKARQRMIAQYAVAAAHAGVVIGTDHAAESLMGFFTKFGDGGADVLPLYGLNKRRVRALAEALGASIEVARKVPTADLETLTPMKPDEDSYGIGYEDIDDFLEGKRVSDEVYTTIYRFYDATHHKRVLPITPYDDWRTHALR